MQRTGISESGLHETIIVSMSFYHRDKIVWKNSKLRFFKNIFRSFVMLESIELIRAALL